MFPRTPNSELSSEALACRAQAGSEESFAELVRRHAAPLRRFLWRRVGNEADADDLAQETLIRAHRNLNRFEGRYRFATWLYTIAGRLATSAGRRQRPLVALDDVREEVLAIPEAAASGADAENLWATAFRVLPEPQGRVLWLRYGQGMTVSEIGAAVGRREGSVKVLLHRARRRLADILPDPYGGERGGQP